MYLIFLLFALVFGSQAAAQSYQPGHSMLILLDKDTIENVTNANSYLLHTLCAALVEKQTPFLVNAKIWHAFLERRAEFEQRKDCPDTKEAWLWSTYNSINQQLNEWYDLTFEQTHDPVQSKDVAVAMINKHFADKKIIKQYKKEGRFDIDATTTNALLCYKIPFNTDDWSVYECDGYYLFVPLQWCKAREDKKNANVCDNGIYTEREQLLGLQVDHLTRIESPCDVACDFYITRKKSGLLSDVVPLIFTKRTFDLNYAWNIYLMGHGLNASDVTNPRLADLTHQEFHALLQFCEQEIPVHIFIYQTCFGSGSNTELVFNQPETSNEYSFPIISYCLGDNVAVGSIFAFWLPNRKALPLSPGLVEYDEKNKWQLWLVPGTNIVKFFHIVQAIDFSKQFDLQDLAYFGLHHASIFENMAQFRPAKSRQFISLYPPNTSKLSQAVVALYQSKNLSISLKTAILLLLEARSIPISVEYENDRPFAIVSLIPGKAAHYLKSINADKIDVIGFLDGFLQLAGACFEKQYYIDQVILKVDVADSFIQKLGIPASPAGFANVFIVTERDNLLRVFFTIEKRTFAAVLRRIGGPQLQISSVKELSDQAAEKYLTYYQTMVNELQVKTETGAQEGEIEMPDEMANKIIGQPKVAENENGFWKTMKKVRDFWW